jgi:DNA-binding PadR family transcriptional regulator
LVIRQLTRFEIDVMAAVLKRGEAADSASIRDDTMTDATGRPSLSAIHVTLDRLERNCLVSWTPSDGAKDGFGRKDRRYSLTADGLDLLRRARQAPLGSALN